MHWLKYIRLNGKDWLENVRGTILEVTMLAVIIEAHSTILSVYQCVTWPK